MQTAIQLIKKEKQLKEKEKKKKQTNLRNFPGGPEVKNPPCNAGDLCSIPGQ